MTDSPHCFVNLVGEVKQLLFDYRPYEERKNLIRRLTQKLRDRGLLYKH